MFIHWKGLFAFPVTKLQTLILEKKKLEIYNDLSISLRKKWRIAFRKCI